MITYQTDGTVLGTRVFVDDKLLVGVKRIEIIHDSEGDKGHIEIALHAYRANFAEMTNAGPFLREIQYDEHGQFIVDVFTASQLFGEPNV